MVYSRPWLHRFGLINYLRHFPGYYPSGANNKSDNESGLNNLKRMFCILSINLSSTVAVFNFSFREEKYLACLIRKYQWRFDLQFDMQ